MVVPKLRSSWLEPYYTPAKRQRRGNFSILT